MELQTKSSNVSKLFISNSLEVKEEFEEKFERSFQLVEGHLAAHQNDKELHEVLSKLVCNDKQHEEVSIGLLYVILISTDHQTTAKTYRDLTLVNRDGLNLITNNLSILVCEKYQKLTDVARRQLLWMLRELVKNQVNNADGVMFNCLRQASGGDISIKNLTLVEGLLDIFIEFRQWLDKFPFLISTVIFSYVRLIEDHFPTHLAQLRAKEVKFVIQLIRERFIDVIPLGRDFVRLLQNVSRIPEFNQLWKDILNNPKALAPSFNGIWHLLQIRTSRRFFQCRLTPEVERKFHYLVSSVKFGNQKRYQDWFQDRYFSTAESQTLRSDLIRFLVNVIHPTNEVLCSDIIPRWAVIGWLLTSCTNPIAMANAKLALFYDWLVFDPNKDNIMNIEPGILVMYHSIKTHPLVTNTLLDFLVRIMKNFFPKHEDKIKMGIHNSFRKILEKQVVPNLGPLFEFPKLDKDLKTQLQICFSEFYGGGPGGMVPVGMPISPSLQNPSMFSPMDANSLQPIGKRPDEQVVESLFNNYNPFDPNNVTDKGQASGSGSATVKDKDPGDKEVVKEEPEEAMFSDDDEEKEVKTEDFTDDDDDLPLSKVRLKEKPLPEKVDLPPTIQESWNKFLLKRNTPTLEEFLIDFKTISASAIDEDQHDYIVDNLGIILKQKLPQNFFPDSKSDEKLLQESINFPIFQIFRTMYLSEEKLKKPFVLLLSGLYEKIPSFGYLLLYFLKVFSKLQTRKTQQSHNQHNASSSSGTGSGGGSGGGAGSGVTSYPFKISLYKQLCESMEEKMDKCLVRDLQALENEYSHIFIWLITDVYREFKSIVVNNSDIIRIILSTIDSKNLRDLIYNVIQGKLTMFKTDSLIDCIRKSLEYETFEQMCFWQLLQAHDIPIEYFQDVIPDLESSNHAEALTNMLLLLRNEEPTPELSRLLLSRETKVRGDPFITSTLRFWCQNYEEKLSSIIAGLLTSKYPNSSPNKRKRPMKNSSSNNNSPTSDQLLNHLEHFRRSCRHGNGTGTGLYVQDTMQRALQQAYSHSSDSVKKQYSDLFALAAEDDTSSVSRRGERGRGRKQTSSKKDTNNSMGGNKKNQETAAATVYSSEEDSEDDWTKRKPPKRRKKAISESD